MLRTGTHHANWCRAMKRRSVQAGASTPSDSMHPKVRKVEWAIDVADRGRRSVMV